MQRFHYAWIVAGVAFVVAFFGAASGGAPGLLMVPLEAEYGWPRSAMSFAVSVNLVVFGLIAPFAAALIERLGLRRVVISGLILISLGNALPIFMTQTWHLVASWGILVGAGTGSMTFVFSATVVNRWFVKRRGLVMGVLTAAGATGQLVFLPLLASLSEQYGWRLVCLIVAGCTLAVVPLVVFFLKERPVGDPYGGPASAAPTRAVPTTAVTTTAGTALGTLREVRRSRTFWLLLAGFAICGATTTGLIGTHFLPAAHDHGMGAATAASLLALIGVFDIVGTVASGWLTDRFDSRQLLGVYYGLRGLSLLLLPFLLGPQVRPSLLVFVIVYGLDWVATVPPTIALCREHFGASGTIVFGWVFTGHQVGAAVAAAVAGILRDVLGEYTTTWVLAGALALAAAALSVAIRTRSSVHEVATARA